MSRKLFGKKKKFGSDQVQSEEMSLQITSMADIFTIILVFLLKTYSTGLANVTPSQGVLLPEASAQPQMKDALKVEILRDAVMVDAKAAVPLKNFSFPGSNAEAANSKSDEVYDALLGSRKRMSGDKTDSHLLLLADQRTPYATLKKVMNSAASAGFVDLQLAVVQAD